MRQEKVQLESILIDTCQRLKYEIDRNPRAHAGGKMVFVYQSVLGNKGRIEIDLNYLFRIPLWDTNWRSSPEWLKFVQVLTELLLCTIFTLLGLY